ncbi:MAG: tetratricopeptide repeat protein [Candidatus Omnitrophica bacterium]|nr:tetratricopeptide repeat protein [Candidatus Omnitrophota bacterium]
MKRRTLIELSILIIIVLVSWPFLMSKAAIFINNKGVCEHNRAEVDQAIKSFELSLRLKPQANVLCNLANAFCAKGMPDMAIEEYNKALELDSGCSEAYFGLAHIYEDMGQYQKARDYLEKAKFLEKKRADDDLARLDYKHLVSLYNRVADYFEAQDMHNAELKLTEIIDLDSGFALAYKSLGDIKFARNQIEEAISDYKSAIENGLDDASFYNVYNDVGIAYMRLERYKEAIDYLRKAFELAPHDMDILYSLAGTLRDNGNFEEALQKYRELLNVNSSYPNVHNDIGDIYKAWGKEEQAKREYKSEIEIVSAQADASDPFSKNRLALAYKGLGEYIKAKEVIDKAIQDDPFYPEAYYTRAQIHEYLGEDAQALQDFERAKDLFSSKGFIQRNIMRLETKKPVSKQVVPFSQDLIVFLKNGRQIEGRLKREGQDAITLDVFVGNSFGTVTIQRQDISSMQRIR